MVNRVQAALQKLWKDTMTVSRTTEHTSDYGAERETPDVAYADIKCHLSFDNTNDPNDRVDIPDVEYIGTVFYAPDISIVRNDTVVVMHRSREYSGYAAVPREYESHNEVDLLVRTR